MTSAQRVTSFQELVDMLRGMRGQMVEAGLFLPEDGGQFPLMTFSGRLRGVEFAEESSSPRWVLSWSEDGDPKPVHSKAALWEEPFHHAELSFTGAVEDGLEGIDETVGHNIFLKIHSEGWILDLTSYV
jgi:hypothetical protein